MRSILTFGGVCAILLFLTGPATAQATDQRWRVLDPDEKQIVDFLAADFFEDSLRLAQSRAIEARTAKLYVDGDSEERARFRAARRASWREMSPEERQTLRGVDRPAYVNLTEAQKAPFRKIALDKLEAAGAVDDEALAAALRGEI